MATIIIPTPFRKFTNNTARLNVAADTIAQTVDELSLNFPRHKKHLLDDNGYIRPFVNIFVGMTTFATFENSPLLSSVPNPEVSDTTDGDNSTDAGKQTNAFNSLPFAFMPFCLFTLNLIAAIL